MSTLDDEFSWHTDSIYKECIETDGRAIQALSNCWAISLASVIGDAYCIKNKLKAIYPSSMWITTLLNDYLYVPKPIAPKVDLSSLLKEDFLYFLQGKYLKLEKCYPQNKTIDFFYGKRLKNAELPKCCLDCIATEFEKEKKDINKKYSCRNDPEICSKNDIIYNFNIRIEKFYYKNERINIEKEKKNFKNNINIIKHMIKCHGTILTSIDYTDEYSLYKQNILREKMANNEIGTHNIPIFEPTIKGKIKDIHTISVVGWGKDGFGTDFWWVRDPQLSFLLKITFPRTDNFEYYTGPFYNNLRKYLFYISFDISKDPISIYNIINQPKNKSIIFLSTIFITSVIGIAEYLHLSGPNDTDYSKKGDLTTPCPKGTNC